MADRMKTSERFHRAARDGYLDLLREATRKDCDRSDEDGMTPTLWAAYFGNLDTLRLILARGGNPDKCDHTGRTALHCAAERGHIACVTFLVNFGINIWALDNDYHTALDVAAINEYMQIVHFLDAVIAKQSALNTKLVKKLKERSVLEAQKRVKEFTKRQVKSQKKAKQEDRKITDLREKLKTTSLKSQSLPRPMKTTDMDIPSFNRTNSLHNEHIRPYSDHFSTSRRPNHAPAIMRKINHHKKRVENGSVSNDDFRISEKQDGKKSIRSLSGLRRDAQVLYVGDGSKSFDKRSYLSEPDLMNGDSGIVSYDESPPQHESASLFDRPGLGTIAFLKTPIIGTGAMRSLPERGENNTTGKNNNNNLTIPTTSFKRQASFSDSIGTLGSLAKRAGDLPWRDEDLDLDDDQQTSSPLELFLASYNLTEFIQILNREKIDLEALLLCSDKDLKELGIPLGPRRKMLDAARKRQDMLNSPGVIFDTRL